MYNERLFFVEHNDGRLWATKPMVNMNSGNPTIKIKETT
jgi:hypothetical protein